MKNNAKLKLVVDSAGAEYYCIAITKVTQPQRRDQQTDQSNQKDGTYDKLSKIH